MTVTAPQSDAWAPLYDENWAGWPVPPAAASDPATPPRVLAAIVDGRGRLDRELRAAVAGNPSTPPEVLSRLLHDRQALVVHAAAGNPSTPAPELRHLLNTLADAGDRATAVCDGATNNPDLPADILHLLATRFESLTVRISVAAHRNTGPDTFAFLMRLTREGEPGNYPAQIHHLSRILARNPSTPARILAELATSSDPVVRDHVRLNPTTDADLRVILALTS